MQVGLLTLTPEPLASIKRGKTVKLTIVIKNPSAIALKKVKTCVKLPKGFKLAKKTGFTVKSGLACRTTATLAAGTSKTVLVAVQAPRKTGKASFIITVVATDIAKVTKTVKATVR
ncbi:unannotated protein [freshwater metagenome]|uniref:Unannotated protein n=1 Tax=freshwater metagenome TaxID=449393 RepID=A0A6J7EAZ8_9ZZZZ